MDKGDACAYTVSVIRNIRYLLAKAVKSDVYSAVLTLIAFLCYYFEAYFVLVGFMVTAALLALIFQRSVIYAFLPLMLTSLAVVDWYEFSAADIGKVLPWGIIFLLALVAHFVIYPVPAKQIKTGPLFVPLAAYSVIMLICGAGAMDAALFFKGLNVYYRLALGIGALITYFAVVNYLPESKEELIRALVAAMLFAGILGIAEMTSVFGRSIASGQTMAIRYRNNISGLMLFTLPFPFYAAVKARKGRTAYFVLGLVLSAAIVLSSSRAALIVDTFITLLCVICCVLTARPVYRAVYSVLLVGVLAGVALFVGLNPEIADGVLGRLPDMGSDIRNEIWAFGMETFKKHPLLGAGLGEQGKYYVPDTGAIFWYHNTFVQSLASTGIAGTAVMLALYGYKLKTLLGRPRLFNVFVFLSLLAYEGMALMHPFTFFPVPFVTVSMILYACVSVKSGKDAPDERIVLLPKTKDNNKTVCEENL